MGDPNKYHEIAPVFESGVPVPPFTDNERGPAGNGQKLRALIDTGRGPMRRVQVVGAAGSRSEPRSAQFGLDAGFRRDPQQRQPQPRQPQQAQQRRCATCGRQFGSQQAVVQHRRASTRCGGGSCLTRS